MIGKDGRCITNGWSFCYFDNLMYSLYGKSCFRYELTCDPALEDGEGTTRYHDLGISVNNIFVNCSKSIYMGNSDDPVDDLDFMKTYVAIYHEGQHWNQVRKDGHAINSSVSTKLTVNRFSKLNNPSLGMSNYLWDPTEVDACGVGLYQAYRGLLPITGEREANRLCCLYENYCLKQGHHQWLGKKRSFEYTDVNDIFADYERGFQKALHRTRNYRLIPQEELGSHCLRFPNDAVVLGKQKDGCKQDLMITAIHFRNPNLKFVKQYFASIRNLDFDMKKLFQHPRLSERIFGLDRSRETEDYSISDRYKDISFETSLSDDAAYDDVFD